MRSLSMPSNGAMAEAAALQHSDFFGNDKSILEKFKKSEEAFSNLCKNEPNLSMLTSKISSILEQGMLKQRKRNENKSPAMSMAPPRKGGSLGQLDDLMQQPMIQQQHEFGGNAVEQHALMGMTRNQDEL